ncbi:MAG: hypothetical protein AB2L12_15415 [Smithellaceae bacterium]
MKNIWKKILIYVIKLSNLKQEAIMDRKEIVLAGLSAGNCDLYSPVQVQKLFFLIDRNIAEKINGQAFFDFQPYNYGPFDKDVYTVLEVLSNEGYVQKVGQGAWTSFKLSQEGQKVGSAILDTLPTPEQEYIKAVSQFVRKLSFSELVSAIYKAYPEMKANSVFQN